MLCALYVVGQIIAYVASLKVIPYIYSYAIFAAAPLWLSCISLLNIELLVQVRNEGETSSEYCTRGAGRYYILLPRLTPCTSALERFQLYPPPFLRDGDDRSACYVV